MPLGERPTGTEALRFLEEYNDAAYRPKGKGRLAKEWGATPRQLKSWATAIREEIQIQQVTAPSSLSELEGNVLFIVQKGAASIGELSRAVDRSAETVIKVIDSLREKSYEVKIDEARGQAFIPQEPSKNFQPTNFKYFRKLYRIGLVSDTHLCSRYQQITLLYDAYKIFDDRKVDFVLHSGDLVDGMDMYRGHHNEIFKHGADEQKDYAVETYPKLSGNRKTYVIGGQHDNSFFKSKGHNIVEAICKERKDLVYRGFFNAQFLVKGLMLEIRHPGGGVSYARSYKMQKIIENMIGYINSVPTADPPVLEVFGHWHIPCHLPSYMGVDAVSLPCFQSMTPYLAEKGLMPTVGCAVAEIQLSKNNQLSSTKIEFIIMNSRVQRRDF